MFPAAGEPLAMFSSGAVICRIAWLRAEPDSAAEAAAARREGSNRKEQKPERSASFHTLLPLKTLHACQRQQQGAVANSRGQGYL